MELKNGFPTPAECLAAAQTYGRKMQIVATNLASDTFATKHPENKKKMKAVKEKAERHQYSMNDVKKATAKDNVFTSEERTHVLGSIGGMYLCSALINKLISDTFGDLLQEAAPGAKSLYKFIIEGIEIQNQLLLAFTDRFTYNARECGRDEYGIDLNLNEMLTDLDVLNIDNVIKSFSTRFRKQIEAQEAIIEERWRQEQEAAEKEQLKAAKKETKKRAKKQKQ